MATTLDLVIKAHDQASSTLGAVDKKAGGLTSTFKKVGAVGGVAAAAGIGLAITAGIKFIQAAAEEEAGIKRLATAIDANGGSWEKQGKAIEDVVRQREKLAFSDDDLRSSMALLVAQTGNVDEAIRRQAVAMDFARGAGIDLSTASKLLGKVTDENVNVLARYGIRAKEGMDATELLGLVQQKFAGQSAAFADTAAGRWQRFNQQMDNLKETIGAALLPIVTKLAAALATWMEEHQTDIEEVVAAWNAWATSTLWPTLEAAMTQLGQLIDGIVKTGILQWLKDNQIAAYALAVAFGVLWAAMMGPLVAIPLLVAGGILLMANWDQIRAKIAELKADFETDWPAMAVVVEGAMRVMNDVVNRYFAIIKADFEFWDAVLHGEWGDAWRAIVELTKLWGGVLIDAIKGIVTLGSLAFGAFVNAVISVLKDMPKLVLQIGKDIGNALVDGIVAAIKGAGSKIKNAFPDLTPNLPGLPSIPHFASGGIVTSPTLALIGERGPEAVVPLGAGIAGGTTVNFYYQPTISTASPGEMQRAAIQLKSILRGAL